MMDRQAAGQEAEDRALQHLLSMRWRLVCRNYRWARGPNAKGGEIDLIMRDPQGTLVFVEVRQRGRGDTAGGALASVNRSKQRHLIYAARRFLLGLAQCPPCRFDVIAIDGERLQWIAAAFEGDGA
ncbi:YraN family protein [Amphibiibacter pelophylacis]|uniref:YraN family protein n=1 Tax=Amphibiibacter pelophylacis TaxID=1799477 RepID=A0ACC6P1M4_9BURK